MAKVQTLGSQQNYHESVQRVLIVILLLNLVVVIGKAVAGWFANSLTVLSDAIHSTVDMLNNVMGIVLIRYASAPPDREHPYGHSKFETLGAFSVAGFLFITCFEIAVHSLRQLFAVQNTLPDISPFTVITMLATIAINLFVTTYEARRGRELSSELLRADAAHTRSDVYVSASVLLSFFFVSYGYGRIDALFALGIALIIAYNGYQLFRQTVPILVDAAMLDPRRIEQIALSLPGVYRCYNIRSRGRPGDLFIEMVVIVESHNLIDAHALTEKIEQALRQEFGRAAITIHFEPTEATE
ncbi:MAG: cation diffusion facilitator family transporter [Acidobacteriota bacterium]